MPSPPRLTAADAETLLVSAAFLFLERRGHHRIYGRGRTRIVVPFDGRPELHPKIVRMIVESMERSRPTPSFEVDKTIVGMEGGAPPPVNAGAWVTEPGDLTLENAFDLELKAPPQPAAVTKASPPKASPPRPPQPKAAQPKADDTLVIPPTPIGRPAAEDEGGEDIDLPRKPKGAWS